jgi:hypothetical protein
VAVDLEAVVSAAASAGAASVDSSWKGSTVTGIRFILSLSGALMRGMKRVFAFETKYSQ